MQFNNIAKRLTKDICLYIMSIIAKLHNATKQKGGMAYGGKQIQYVY